MNAHSRLAHRPRTARRGFTLVEILTVVLIIGILMAFAVPAVFRALERAKVGRVRVEIEGMEQAINSYIATWQWLLGVLGVTDAFTFISDALQSFSDVADKVGNTLREGIGAAI
ncbi:MAG: prepilin-type N-terminal cleavage/methylation domain-containing protein, partial [Pirellulales bacterium]|nr:prepilin-type N-terminal cleavage/methylation domain-containing protein [Pirellulales bacterium]